MNGDEWCNGGTALWPHTPSRPKPTLNIDHRGPVDDTAAGVGRSAASMASIIVQLLMEVTTRG
jgi:nanoRNase/pAp phosphatase (c-di-AMP/oligoRNAs hydrolase)